VACLLNHRTARQRAVLFFVPQSCHAFFNISPTFPLSVPFDGVKMKKKTLPVEGSPKSNPMIAPRF
jgi:hypothetical protein